MEVFKNIDKLVVVEGKEHSGKPSTIISLDTHTVLREGEVDGNKVLKELEN